MFCKIKEFLKSLRYFIELYRGGFRIHRNPPVMKCTFYRFYWFDDVIKDMADIDVVSTMSGYSLWNTLRNGHVERLGERNTHVFNYTKYNTNEDTHDI